VHVNPELGARTPASKKPQHYGATFATRQALDANWTKADQRLAEPSCAFAHTLREQELTMSSSATLQKLSEIMEDTFDVEGIKIDENTTAEDIEEWDSLSHIRLVVAVEREFGIKFKNSELDGLMKVGDFVKLINSKLSAQA
jgi:acyl carrier protein